MIDFHCHLDSYKNPLVVFDEVKRRNVKVLAVATSPRAHLKTSQYSNNTDNVRVVLGSHSELVADRRNEIDLFMEQISKSRYTGEVGIDGASRSRHSYFIQKASFYGTLGEAEKHHGRIISIHSRRAVKDVLECIKKALDKGVPIMHRLTRNIKELQKALSLGYWFNINPKMRYLRAGRDIIVQMSLNKILPKTDAPFTEKNGMLYMPWDMDVAEFLAVQYGRSITEVKKQMESSLLEVINGTTALKKV